MMFLLPKRINLPFNGMSRVDADKHQKPGGQKGRGQKNRETGSLLL